MLYRVDYIAEEVYSVLSDIDADPTGTLNEIESRLDKITKLKRKYGLTVEDVLAFRDKAYKEYEALENSDDLIKSLTKKEAEAYNKALSLANKLHDIRIEAVRGLEEQVKETLEFLDMTKLIF